MSCGLYYCLQLLSKKKIHLLEIFNGLKIEGPVIFWRQLQSIQHILHWCTTWEIGDGQLTSFWFHAWNGLPIGRKKAPRPQQPYISLGQGLPLCQTIAPELLSSTNSIVLSSAQDRIVWRWTTHSLYTAKSVYTKMMEGGGLQMITQTFGDTRCLRQSEFLPTFY